MSDPLRVVTNPNELLGARLRAQTRQECNLPVFTGLSFLRQAILLTKTFMQARENLQHPDLEPFCFSGSGQDGGTIEVGVAYKSEQPATNAVWLKLGALEYAPSAFGGEHTTSSDYSTAYRIMRVRGTLEWVCEARDPEVALHLTDRLATHLEGTKQRWMLELGLHDFVVQGQTALSFVDAGTNKKLACTLRAKFTGDFTLATMHEGLPLSRVDLEVTC